MDKFKMPEIIGFQRLVCKNPECHNILKKIEYTKDWMKKISENNGGIKLVKNNGSSYYVCPKCKSKNYIVLQGEKIILEKIVRYELNSPVVIQEDHTNVFENQYATN